MSQTIIFYKLVLYSEKAAEFSRENIHESLKALFKGSDRVASDMVNEYFEEVKLDEIEISYEQFLKVDGKFESRIKRIFSKEQSSFFFVDEKDWAVVQQLVESRMKHLLSKDDQAGLAERLNKISMISSDYNQLKRIYEKKLLLVDII